MATKTRNRTGGTHGQIAIGFEGSDVQAMSNRNSDRRVSLADDRTMANIPLTIDEYIDKYGTAFIEYKGETIHYGWYLKELEKDNAQQCVAPELEGEHWLIDFKVYDIVFASSIRFFPMPMSVFKKHPEGIVIKPGIYSVDGVCTEEDINELYKWASSRSDFKILGTNKLETPVENETARINLEDC